MDTVYKPYFDPDFESLIERIHPPSVSIDNDTWPDCTLVKVDSANKHGILLEMVQVLTDLDLVISKSYICSDGGWFMDVFHVTDQFGRKVTDESLLLYIQQAMCASRRASQEVKACAGREVRPIHVSADHTALEITGLDRPGLMSEISAVLTELECHVAAAAAWTHNGRVACIIYVDEPDLDHAADARALLENVVEAHHPDGERFSVGVEAPAADRAHTERRLHQLMWADGDYDRCGGGGGGRDETHVTIDHCKERGYSVVSVRSRDRPKLLFDTVCTLTDMEYVVFHAAVSSRGSIAFQEYYIRHMDGCTLDSASERRRVAQCLIAATERRVSHGLRLDVLTRNQLGLLSDITRVFREHGLSITRAEIGIRGERAVGSFYVTDASGQDANPETVEMVRQEIGGTVLMVNNWPSHSPQGLSQRTSRKNSEDDNKVQEEGPRFSLGAMLWSHLERLSGNFRPIRS